MISNQALYRKIGYENIYAKNIKNEEIMNLELDGFMKYL